MPAAMQLQLIGPGPAQCHRGDRRGRFGGASQGSAHPPRCILCWFTDSLSDHEAAVLTRALGRIHASAAMSSIGAGCPPQPLLTRKPQRLGQSCSMASLALAASAILRTWVWLEVMMASCLRMAPSTTVTSTMSSRLALPERTPTGLRVLLTHGFD